jgi:hypothetical protein
MSINTGIGTGTTTACLRPLGRPDFRSVARHAGTNRYTESPTRSTGCLSPEVNVGYLISPVRDAAIRPQLVLKLRYEPFQPALLEFVRQADHDGYP